MRQFNKVLLLFIAFIVVFIIGVLFGIEGIQWKVYNEVLKPCNESLGANQRCVLVATPEFIE
jgi:hypothetical protein